VIEVAGLIAFGSGCAICARLGFMRGRVVGEKASDDMNHAVLEEAEAVLKVAQQADHALAEYQKLFDYARPILEEHTWHKTKRGAE
jgi:hypothetical protein